MKNIGERIVFLREEQNISQKELAISIQTTAATLSRYENNKCEPNAEITSRLARALHTTADFLLGLTENYHHPDTDDPCAHVTAEEFHLLDLYRCLDPEDQVRIHERILTLLEKNNPRK